jgi:hypothetical protein
MTYGTRELALRVLRHVLIGRQAVGMYWWNSMILFAIMKDGHSMVAAPEAFLTMGHHWALLEGYDGSGLPELDMLPVTARQHLAHTIVDLFPHKVMDVDLDENAPILLIHFEDGKTLVSDGSHPRYETWTLDCGDFQVVATPGDTIDVGFPDGFID